LTFPLLCGIIITEREGNTMATKEQMHLEKKVLEYFEKEYYWSCSALDSNLAEPWEIVHNAKQRMLGVGHFVQTLGIDYNTLEMLYNDYTERLDNLIKEI
jgi:hypothetical protein